jgi:hypothetical protein
MTRTLDKHEREEVREAIATLESLGWSVTEYQAAVERPVKVPQTRLEVVAYQEP